jgi:hypothetical protein
VLGRFNHRALLEQGGVDEVRELQIGHDHFADGFDFLNDIGDCDHSSWPLESQQKFFWIHHWRGLLSLS